MSTISDKSVDSFKVCVFCNRRIDDRNPVTVDLLSRYQRPVPYSDLVANCAMRRVKASQNLRLILGDIDSRDPGDKCRVTNSY